MMWNILGRKLSWQMWAK